MLSHLVALLPLLAVASAAPSHFKRADNQQIHLNGDTSKCLSVDKLENGSPVVNVPCDNGLHNGWTVQNGNNDQGVRLTGTNFCLDSGVPATNNGHLKIWQCYPGAPQQTWWYTDDKHLAITGGDQCVDVGQDYVQTYQCIGYNTNQIWTLGDAPSVSTSVAPSSSAPSASSSSAPPPSATGTQIHFQGSSTGCLQVGGGTGGLNSDVYIGHCANADDTTWFNSQQFDVQRNQPGVITFSNDKTLCLDASSSGAWTNGSGIKLQRCNPALQSQQWFYTDDNHLAIVGGNQCLNVKRESTFQPIKPYGTIQDLQTWQCDGSDPQQVFTV